MRSGACWVVIKRVEQMKMEEALRRRTSKIRKISKRRETLTGDLNFTVKLRSPINDG